MQLFADDEASGCQDPRSTQRLTRSNLYGAWSDPPGVSFPRLAKRHFAFLLLLYFNPCLLREVTFIRSIFASAFEGAYSFVTVAAPLL